MRKQLFLFILIYQSLIPLFAQQAFNPFEKEVAKFRELDALNPPPRHAILFIGSSSFTLWNDVNNYFPGYNIINRAFGGSRLTDQIEFFHQVVTPYDPRQVVIYCGENDFAASDTLTPGMVTKRFITLFELFRAQCPDAKITYVSMKPSPSRWHLSEKFIEANHDIRLFLEKNPNTSFVDIWNQMLDVHHQPDSSIFLEDMLHMNAKGYQIWQKEILPHLIQ